MKALELRIQGLTYEAIANRLGLSDRMRAYEAVSRAISASVSDKADELRRIEDRRLDRMIRRVERALRSADPEQVAPLVSSLLRIQERRARLYGLDAPKRVEVSTPKHIPVVFVDDWRGGAIPDGDPEPDASGD